MQLRSDFFEAIIRREVGSNICCCHQLNLFPLDHLL
jgi:hypothetical protein